MEEKEWIEWVTLQSQRESKSEGAAHVPKTGALLSLMGYLIYPSLLQRIAVNYGLQQLSQGIFYMGASSAQQLFMSLISMPYKKLQETKNIDLDSVIKSHAQTGLSLQDIFSQVTETNQNMMLLLASVSSLYFQFKGMSIMKEENAKYKGLSSNIISDKTNTAFEKYIFRKYDSASYYKERNESLLSQKTLEMQQYDPVRIIYNILVGMNHTLFYCMGGRSDDPTHEIIHWTKVLFYWEILARLLNRHGVGPMNIASEIFLNFLWTKKGKKVK
jgi:hypothetical protein